MKYYKYNGASYEEVIATIEQAIKLMEERDALNREIERQRLYAQLAVDMLAGNIRTGPRKRGRPRKNLTP